jgi:FtsZ-interacting cell division protein ZipA
MSDLQLSLLALGAVVIGAVVAFNVWQERKARGKAERAFGKPQADALFDAPRVAPKATPAERVEPTLGAMAPQVPNVELTEPPPGVHEPVAMEELDDPKAAPAAQISSRIDTVAVILADDLIMKERLAPLHDALRRHATPVHMEGIVDEQWHPIEGSSRYSWRELRVGLQLASRAGPVEEAEIERFNNTIAEFAAGVNAVSQREAPATAAERARELDRFCADADIEVAVNVIGAFGATLAVPRVKQLALEFGLSETASGELVSFASDGTTEFSLRRFDDPATRLAPETAYAGITFALDLPHLPDPVATLDDMIQVAHGFAEQLAGQLVDDNRKPLTDAGLASIRRSTGKIVQDMEANGVPAGSALAQRLFS